MEFNPLDKESVIERANGGELFRYKIAFLPHLFLRSWRVCWLDGIAFHIEFPLKKDSRISRVLPYNTASLDKHPRQKDTDGGYD